MLLKILWLNKVGKQRQGFYSITTQCELNLNNTSFLHWGYQIINKLWIVVCDFIYRYVPSRTGFCRQSITKWGKKHKKKINNYFYFRFFWRHIPVYAVLVQMKNLLQRNNIINPFSQVTLKNLRIKTLLSINVFIWTLFLLLDFLHEKP